ncbi:hypothetical protein EJB05_56169, partial [Eragrostis curvula]
MNPVGKGIRPPRLVPYNNTPPIYDQHNKKLEDTIRIIHGCESRSTRAANQQRGRRPAPSPLVGKREAKDADAAARRSIRTRIMRQLSHPRLRARLTATTGPESSAPSTPWSTRSPSPPSPASTPATHLTKHWLRDKAKLLNPAFNLTLRVASPSTASGRECVEASTAVEVSYLRSRVPLATGPVPAFCVEVGEEREEGSVVAWGHGVRLPSFVFDSLAADMPLGKAEFGVKLIPPLPAYCGGGKSYCSSVVSVISCWSKIGGDRAPCNVSIETASLSVLRPGRDSTHLRQKHL